MSNINTASTIGKGAARASAALVLAVPALLGAFVAAAGLHDPDTCWLLALGRWVFEHGHLPRTDPFSYTYSLTWGSEPIVMYQWLAEVVFFLAYKTAALPGLLVLTACVLACAFYVLPVRILCRCGLSILPAAGLALLMVLAGGFHFLVRPEIFSYLLLAMFIEMLVETDSAPRGGGVRWGIVLKSFLVMMLWCNLHSGFVLGLLLQALFAVACLAKRGLASGSASEVNLTALIVPVASLLATLVNPWGAGLWIYLMRLFFGSFNKHIFELEPLYLSDLVNPLYYGFLAILLAAVPCVCFYLPRARGTHAAWFGIACLALAVCAGAGVRRLIPFAALFLLAGLSMIIRASCLAHNEQARQDQAGVSILERWQQYLSAILRPAAVSWPFGVLAMTCLGTALISLWIAPPELPKGNPTFRAPWRALAFLTGGVPHGRLLNDPQFGDVMIWYMAPAHLLFIDTRFDMYGDRLVQDYLSLVRARPNWQQLIERYRISWVFLKPELPLVDALQQKSGWTVRYRDEQAVIIVRSPG